MADTHSKKDEIKGTVKKQALTNKNFVQELRLQMNFTEEMAKEVMEIITKTMYDSLLDDRPIRLNPIGTLTPYWRERKNTINPFTGKMVDSEPRRRVRFSMSVPLKRGLNPTVESYQKRKKKKK